MGRFTGAAAPRCPRVWGRPRPPLRGYSFTVAAACLRPA